MNDGTGINDRFRRSFDRFYLSLSVSEIRESFICEDVDRLPYNTVLYLNLIGFTPGITQSELGERLGISKASVTRTVNRLVSKGLVVRERSEEDGRVRKLRLSDEIQRSYDFNNRKFSYLSENVIGDFGPEDMERLCDVLDRLSDLLDRWNPDNVEED